jgi:hypothetical protein
MEIYVIYPARNDRFIKKSTFGHGNTTHNVAMSGAKIKIIQKFKIGEQEK